jgi:hypothetical protein
MIVPVRVTELGVVGSFVGIVDRFVGIVGSFVGIVRFVDRFVPAIIDAAELTVGVRFVACTRLRRPLVRVSAVGLCASRIAP